MSFNQFDKTMKIDTMYSIYEIYGLTNHKTAHQRVGLMHRMAYI